MKTTLCALLLISVAATAMGDVLYDNGLADNANNGTSGLLADDFTLTGLSTLNQIEWIGVYGYDSDFNYFVPVSENAIVRIFADTGSGPALVPTYEFNITTVTRADAGSMSSWPAFSWTVTIPETQLGLGTYYLSVQNVNMEPPDYWGSNPDRPWHWGYSDQFNGDAYSRNTDGDPWTQGAADFRFAVYGQPVPEPTTTMLLLNGIVVLAISTRKKMRTIGCRVPSTRCRVP